jgi:hypothetical protein
MLSFCGGNYSTSRAENPQPHHTHLPPTSRPERTVVSPTLVW